MKNSSRFLSPLALLLLSATLSALAATNVTTWRQDNARTGQNLAETQLTPANVNSSTFGKLRSYKVDGYVYAQPLYLAGVTIAGTAHNIVFIATEHDSVFAFDADRNLQLWKASLVDVAHGASSNATAVPSADVGTNDLVPEIGITATPVLDPTTNTIYVEAKSKENGGYVHRLHALDAATGNERANSPMLIQASVPGTGVGSVNGTVAFQAQWQLARPGLLLLNGRVYIAFASHGDNGPYHGWILGYDATTLQQIGAYNTAPNGNEGGIWQSGAGLAADIGPNGGRMFIVNGNGQTSDGPPYTDSQSYGNAIERLDLSTAIHVSDQWTPFDTDALSAADTDQGSGGIVLLPDQTGAHPHELVQVGKNGRIEVLDRDNLGGIGTSANSVVQEINGQIAGLWSTPAYWNGSLYFWGNGDALKQFSLQNGLLSTSPTSQSSFGSGFPGASPVISSNGTSDGILWALRTDGYFSGGPALLYAFDATNVANLLYASNQSGTRDTAGVGVKFTVPTVINGNVYVPAQGEVDVYGLFANAPATVPSVTFSPAPGTYPSAQTVTLSVAQPNAAIFYTTDGTVPTASSLHCSGPIAVGGNTTIQAIAVVPGYDNSSVASASYVIGAAPAISYSNGFSSVSGMTLNGSALNSDDSRLQLTNGGYAQGGSAYWSTPVDIRTFSTDFTFQLSGVLPLADGFTFTLQNSGVHAIGQPGGGLGYGPGIVNGPQGIPNSLAIKFDLYSNQGEGYDSTGLYVNGASPTLPSIDLTNSGINLSSGDTMTAHILYDGHTLFLTITDPVARTSFSTNFSINIPQIIRSNTAYAGFTAGTGGLSASQKILTWDFWSDPDLGPLPAVPAPTLNLASGVYNAPFAVTLADSLSGATIYYTTDGTTPTAASRAVTGPITVSATTVLKCIAIAAGYPNSSVVSATYLFPVATPPAMAAPATLQMGSGGSGPLAPVTGDFNGDGKADLAIINVADSSVSVMLGQGNGAFQPSVSYPVGRGPAAIVTGDFNSDGKLDLAVVNTLDSTVTILLNSGTGAFPTAATYAAGSGPVHVSTGDFNRDGSLDLAVTNGTKGTVTILLGSPNGTFQTAATYKVGRSPFGTAVADFNADGYPDLAVWNGTDNTVGLLLNDGTGKFVPQITYATGTDPYSVTVGDFNEDGFPDIAVANRVSGTVSVLLNDATGRLLPQVAYTVGQSPLAVLAADMNGDGVLDLTVSNSADNTLSLLVGKGDGTFLPQTTVPLALQPYIAVAADFNGDGKTDLAVTNYSPSPSAGRTQPMSALQTPRANQVTLLLQRSAANQ